MGAPKLKQFPKPIKATEPAKAADSEGSVVSDKAAIDQIKKSIHQKLKDPTLAKKAAQIIAELLEQEKEQAKNNKK